MLERTVLQRVGVYLVATGFLLVVAMLESARIYRSIKRGSTLRFELARDGIRWYHLAAYFGMLQLILIQLAIGIWGAPVTHAGRVVARELVVRTGLERYIFHTESSRAFVPEHVFRVTEVGDCVSIEYIPGLLDSLESIGVDKMVYKITRDRSTDCI